MIEVRDVSRAFGRFTALADATFSVGAGEIVALLGPNGAGKTTASRIICGILAPSGGDVIVDGVSVARDPDRVRSRCGLVTDSPALYERMTLGKYLEFFARLYDVASPVPRIATLLELLGLTSVAGARLGTFSRGMKQKVAIARALIHEPPVLLLDEPATALDPEMARTFRSIIVSLRADHRAILLCTHDLDEAQRIADRVVILREGRIVREARTVELRAGGSARHYVVSFTGDAGAALAALTAAGIAAEPTVAADGLAELRFRSDDPTSTNPAVLRALLGAGIGVLTIVHDERSLEDAYFAVLAESRPR